MAGPEDADVLERLVAERGTHLLRTAIALAGSRQDGEDLLQAALERLIQRGSKIHGDPEGYLRRTLVNLATDRWRRENARRRRLPLLRVSQRVAEPDLAPDVDLRDALIRALRELPALQRAAVVLRHWEQLSEAETAQLLGCSPGTVKSATSRGLHRMREVAGPALRDEIELLGKDS
ncbi:MAG: SigE family RNA polymerase sigma factor [Actinomycetota bacterium]|nr:SigE family RNA polymerase sigma factor [Actinomycetota bacterium]